ncbi:MAG TPA: sigma-70 family RNA polymerase sigma factor [Thermoanaerobacterales bacterium]|nr:sigma-70 family RNA polymerase sigma factor [Thermoanaerobacterales bacterium]
MHPQRAADEILDEKLIEDVLSGNVDAFAGIMDRYRNRVFTLAYRMLSSREEAEDVSQEAFIKIYRSLKTYDAGRTRFSTWVYRITYNLCIDFLRKRREIAPLKEEIMAASSGGPEEIAEARDSAARLHEAVQNLPEDYRIPLTLFHFHGLSYQEICNVLNVPLSVVKNRLFRARKLLREKLDGGEGGGM